MNQKDKAHWDLPRIPENEFLFRPRYDVSEDRGIEDVMQERPLVISALSKKDIPKND